MPDLRPAEFIYLDRPFWSEGKFMLSKMLQELIIKNEIRIESRQKIVDTREKRTRTRAFVVPNLESFADIDPCDRFFLELFRENGSMWLAELVLRTHAKLDRDSDNFKTTVMYGQLQHKGLLSGSSMLTSKGREARKQLRGHLKEVTEGTESVPVNSKWLAGKLDELGTNFILLEPDVIKRIGKILPELQLAGLATRDNSWNDAMFTYASMDFASFGSTLDSSGFDGFDGGDFGGGGGGDSW